MAINWDLYNKRLNINGSSERERNLNSLKNTISSKLPSSLSCKVVKINDVDRSVEIVKSDKSNIKKIHSLPNETFNTGDYVVYKNTTYLIIETDKDDEVYTSGKIQEINWVLKFQHPTTGAILSYPCITSDKTFAEDESQVITLGANKKSILLRLDENTLLIRNDDTKTWRFFVDKKSPPTPYKLIGDTDTTTYDGLIWFTVEQDELQTDDRPDLGVCDYWIPPVEPEPVDPTVPTRVVLISTDAINNEVKLGLTYSFSVVVKDELGNVITGTQPRYTIDNTYSGKVVLVDKLDGTATIKVDNNAYDLLGNQFTLQCMDMISGFSSSIVFTIVSMW
jgi:hypothetical protein